MIIGIDAANIRGGGGITHLAELLRVADPQTHGFSKIVVWSGALTLSYFDNRPWLQKAHQPLLDKNLFYRLFWQKFRLPKVIQEAKCDILFVPGGSYFGNFQPFVTMNHNLLPFDRQETARYGLAWQRLRNFLLRHSQSKTFKKANGLIFLTHFAKNAVMNVVEGISCKASVIPHGVDNRFFLPPRKQVAIKDYSSQTPFRILYVSLVDVYKHQWHVVEAIGLLKKTGLPIKLDMVGPSHPPALKRLRKTMKQVDPGGKFVQYLGPVPYNDLPKQLAATDLFLFASSCETISITLLEGMASGLSIACSDRGPLPEVLGEAGVYFDPENPQDIARSVRQLVESHSLRTEMARAAFERVQKYSWNSCSTNTFKFLSEILKNHRAP